MYLFIRVWSIFISLYVLMYVYPYNKLDRDIYLANVNFVSFCMYVFIHTRMINIYLSLCTYVSISIQQNWSWHLPRQCQLCKFLYVYMFIQHTWYIYIYVYIYTSFCEFPYVYIYSYVHDINLSLFMYLCIYIHTTNLIVTFTSPTTIS